MDWAALIKNAMDKYQVGGLSVYCREGPVGWQGSPGAHGGATVMGGMQDGYGPDQSAAAKGRGAGAWAGQADACGSLPTFLTSSLVCSLITLVPQVEIAGGLGPTVGKVRKGFVVFVEVVENKAGPHQGNFLMK